MCGALCRRQGVYVGYARRGLVASAPAPTGYHLRAPLSGQHVGSDKVLRALELMSGAMVVGVALAASWPRTRPASALRAPTSGKAR